MAGDGDRLVVSLDDEPAASPPPPPPPSWGPPPPAAPPPRPGRRVPWTWVALATFVVLALAAAALVVVLRSGEEAAAARLEPKDETRSDPFTESVARVSVETFDPEAPTTTATSPPTTEPPTTVPGDTDEPGSDDELDSDTEPDARLTVIEERTIVASLLVFDQAEVPLTEVVDHLRFVPGIKAGAVDAKTDVLDTSVYDSLEPGGWMIFVGPFDSQADARDYCARVTEVAPACEPAVVDGFGEVDPTTDVPPPPEPSPAGIVDATEPGLFAGTAGASSCDQAALVDALERDETAAAAWAGVEGLDPGDIGTYIDGLTAVNLRTDTVVVNHGLVDGAAKPFVSVLEAGTAVLVDNHGVPRTRCTCGGPLLPAERDAVERVRTEEADAFDGDSWQGFDPTKVIKVRGSADPLDSITLVDELTGRTIERPFATTGEEDLADGGTGCGGCPPPTTTTTAPPTVDFSTFDAAGALACDQGCAITGTIEFDHPTWGRSLLVTLGPRIPPGDFAMVVFDQFGVEQFRADFLSNWYELAPNEPAIDDTGHLFVNFNPGRYNGVIILDPIEDGFESFETLVPADSGGFDYNTRFYSARLEDVDGDGTLEVVSEINDCNPSCAGGTTHTTVFGWDGSDYVAT